MSVYLERAKAEIAKAAKREGTFKGPCSECRWRRIGVVDDWCGNPVVDVAAFNQSAGYSKRRITECEYQRGELSIYGPVLCGPDGALFEQKPTLFERLFGK